MNHLTLCADNSSIQRTTYFDDSERQLHLVDEDYDQTVVDLSDIDTITVTQTDEQGNTHTVILSPSMIDHLIPHLTTWKQTTLSQSD